jgi:hypothetical protein
MVVYGGRHCQLPWSSIRRLYLGSLQRIRHTPFGVCVNIALVIGMENVLSVNRSA